MRKYYIDSISYCFPYETDVYLKNHQDKLYGCLLPYMDKEMTEEEADKLICELVMKHPMIEGAMWLEIPVIWKENNLCGFYHIITIRNLDKDRRRETSIVKPIQWRK